MNDFNLLFRQRIGLSTDQKITFDHLDDILDRTARILPFENMSIMLEKTDSITKKHLIDKILKRYEGGLCYELNPLLHFFLLDNAFKTAMYYGRVHNGNEYGDKTHVMFLVKHKGKDYLIDTGFGSNLPLKPVPMSGETIHSRNGAFRIIEEGNAHILEMNLSSKQKGWTNGYKFYTYDPVRNVEDLNTIQKKIINSETSPFNKDPLITSFTKEGRHTLTKTSYSVWSGTEFEKVKIEPDQFHKYAERHFNFKFYS
ncbi:arylamine N-acetyltransferase family protein [Salinicoccus sp. HZC-1]|uniref:arylamine N-acetyltransferase family protein n=1 Tax=Salinicoccus sp. HZC-1 TaxID=3385497 RepID=UPI00398B143E